MARYEWTGPRPFRDHANDREIAPGEVADVDDDVAAAFGAFVPADESEDEGEPEPEPEGETGTLPFNPEAHTVDELAEKAADVDDPAAVRALRNLEEEQNDRTTAVEALEERLADLEG